ncbi:VOC family protein [Planococcus sp. N028]|uniref:VOC family protein n=1 Tax=Planococcus shixiaomingii TaxID=3058393 RepID=A0ABT8N403_9BACL|nr:MULTISPECIES: VOC family protein [unclassified Planococcus (in: firmicutes)]MDN7242612.1 VOC family protein [Planococcus sp. N028]WKA55754.1 VOC family protein [Planococcus sp. N022]
MIVSIHPYLVTNGNGKEAVKFYEEVLDAKVINVQTFGDMQSNSDEPVAEDVKDRIMNAHLKIGTSELMLSDTFPGQAYQLGSQVTLALTVSTVDKTKEVFEKLQEGGEVGMPLQETFWSPSYGQVTDKFGIKWQVTTAIAQTN